MSSIENYGRRRAKQPEKGTMENPYTEEEYEAMLDADTWTGGYVEGIGYCGTNVIIYASASGSSNSSSSSSSSDSSDPTGSEDDGPLIDPPSDDTGDNTTITGGGNNNGNGTNPGGTGGNNTGGNQGNNQNNGGHSSGHGPSNNEDGNNNADENISKIPVEIRDTFYRLPDVLQTFLLNTSVEISYNPNQLSPNGKPGWFSETYNHIHLANTRLDTFFRECVHAVQFHYGMLGNEEDRGSIEYQEAIIGDLYTFFIINVLDDGNQYIDFGYMAMDEEHLDPLLTFFEGSVSGDKLNLRKWEESVLDFAPYFRAKHQNDEQHNQEINNNFDWKWALLFRSLGIPYEIPQ